MERRRIPNYCKNVAIKYCNTFPKYAMLTSKILFTSAGLSGSSLGVSAGVAAGSASIGSTSGSVLGGVADLAVAVISRSLGNVVGAPAVGGGALSSVATNGCVLSSSGGGAAAKSLYWALYRFRGTENFIDT